MSAINKHNSHATTAAQVRKIKKPIIERKRRDRINESLNQLKTLVLDAMDKDESRYNKMEKADILEMTVSYLQSRCLGKSGQPDITEARLTNQLSTPYQPHSRPQHYIQATTLAQLPGTTPVRPRDMTRSSQCQRRPVYVGDSAIPLYVDATPTFNRVNCGPSPNGSNYSDQSPSISPGGSTTCSPPSILFQASSTRQGQRLTFSPSTPVSQVREDLYPLQQHSPNPPPVTLSAMPALSPTWRPW